MLETIDLELSLDKATYQQRKEEIHLELYRIQHQCRQAGLGVIVVFEGWDFAGKLRAIQYLTDALDPRGFKVHVMYPPTDEERQFPFARRYLIRLPERGNIAFFLRSWYYHVLDERVQQGTGELESAAALEEIRLFEKSLADDGYLLLKFWLHISQDEQRHRRKKHRKNGSIRRWATGPDDPKQHKRYAAYYDAAERMLATTSTDFARWYPVPANDLRYAKDAIATKLINRVKDELALRANEKAAAIRLGEDHMPPAGQSSSVLGKVDLGLCLSEKEYEARIEKIQWELIELQYECAERRRTVLFVFEGWDAAGKGGVIQRLTRRLDPRYFEVHSIGAPRGDEANHHYLWRFWKRIPPAGHWAIFDRSWYGRVLVERVEGFASVVQWRRGYSEINDFEATLYDSGALLLKFWLHISQDEQLRRFEERKRVEYKWHKITEEDWRNRDKWPLYEQAAEDVFQRTSTPYAPWSVVPANDKGYARVYVLERAIELIRQGLGHRAAALRPRG